MHHSHDHGPVNYRRAFAIAVGLNAVYILAEVVFGVWAGSLALLADAGHNLSDVLGLLLAWGAYVISGVRPTRHRTYGWRSTSILAALINAVILVVAVGGIAWEAIERFWEPQAVSGGTVIAVAGLGVVVNGLTAALFLADRKRDLNIRGAYLHMAADAGVSLAVVVAGLAMLWTSRPWIDPLVSLAVAVVILVSTWGLLRDSINLALHAVPRGIDPEAVDRFLRQIPGVVDVHDLHIWGMSTTETALTAHLIKPQVENEDALLGQIGRELHDRFGIEHTTLQIERNHDANLCRQLSPDRV
jgi:cobalt-zinc-cadmium efflux system protein